MPGPFPGFSQVETEPYCLYILMRNDLDSLNPGKACAQAAHAANQFVFESCRGNELSDGYLEWRGETHKGFGTTIVLGASMRQIQDAMIFVKALGSRDVVGGIVHDPTYPVQDGVVVHIVPLDTCAYVFGPRSIVKRILDDLSLMP